MKRYMRMFAALAAPAAAAAVIAAPANAATAPAAFPMPPLRCHASMSNYRPRDFTVDYVNVGTSRYAIVTAVAHYRMVSTRETVRANGWGNAEIGYHISGVAPGYRVNVTVTVMSGRSRGFCWTSFVPRR